MSKKLLYIGEFPPPFGGVTIKNQLILDEIFDKNSYEVINLYDCKNHKIMIPVIFARIAAAFVTKRKLVYGIGCNSRLEKLLLIQFFLGGKRSLDHTIIMMMGGTLQDYLATKSNFKSYLKYINMIYVESNGIKKQFEKMGILNVKIFPNCRTNNNSIEPQLSHKKDKIKCVYFSKICKEKGILSIIEMVKILENESVDFCLDFYGHVDSNIKSMFFEFIENYKQVNYFGIFDSVKKNVYQKLNEYDVLLFPTEWKNEGVPGILVESKMAGITAIVSNQNFNSEVVIDGIEGVVMENQFSQKMANQILEFARDKDLLNNMKKMAYDSRIRYDIAEYKDEILETIFN